MSGQGIPRSVFERALKRALVTLAVAEGILPTAHDANANHELYQRLCVFIDMALETEGIENEAEASRIEGEGNYNYTAHGGPAGCNA